MALKAVVPDINAVPENLRSLYTQRDGKFVLDLEGDVPGYVPAQKHAEFRENNVKLLKALGAETVEAALQRAGLFTGLDSDRLAKLKDIDPAVYAELKAKADALEKKGVKGVDDVEALKKSLLEDLKASVVGPLQAQLAEMQKASQAKDQRIADATLRSAVAERFAKAGGKASASGFIVEEAKKAFRVVDDRVVAVDGRFGSDGEPLTLDAWVAGATKEYDFAFEPSKGGGAAPAGAGGAPAHKGPFKTPSGEELKMDGITVLS
jgi:hypothetical protein